MPPKRGLTVASVLEDLDIHLTFNPREAEDWVAETGFAATAATGMLPALLALRKVRSEMAEGRIPAGQIVDGVIILLAGAVLMTPGVLTDAWGFLCLVPAFRGWLKRALRRRFERAVERGDAKVTVDFHGTPFGSREVRDVTPREERIEGPEEPPEA